MPTAREVKAAQKLLEEALIDAGLAISRHPGAEGVLVKTHNCPENAGLTPFLAFSCALIRQARAFETE